MACNKWEETGLLFSCDELSDKESGDFREHMQVCSECAFEYDAYQKEKSNFFTLDILGALPSKKCDEEIYRVCSDGRKKIVTIRPLSLIVKRTLVSLVLFIIGFTGVGYITFKMNNPELQNNHDVAKIVNVPATDSIKNIASDSASDTTPVNSVNFAKTRGNLELKGVYPVDLQNK